MVNVPEHLKDSEFEDAYLVGLQTAEILRENLSKDCAFHNQHVMASKGPLSKAIQGLDSIFSGNASGGQNQGPVTYHVLPLESVARSETFPGESPFTHVIKVVGVRPDEAEVAEQFSVSISPNSFPSEELRARLEASPQKAPGESTVHKLQDGDIVHEGDYFDVRAHSVSNGRSLRVQGISGHERDSDTPLGVGFDAKHLAYAIRYDLVTRGHEQKIPFSSAVRGHFAYNNAGIKYEPGADKS